MSDAVLVAPCALYRFFDAGGALLYVGITGHLPARTNEHGASKAWWPQVVSMSVEHFATRNDARLAEQRAIDCEQPMHNVARSIGKTPLHSFRCPDDLWKAAQARAEERGENWSEELRKMVERYVKRRS